LGTTTFKYQEFEFSMAVTLSTSENYHPLMSYNCLKYLNLHSDQQSNLIQIALKRAGHLYGKYARLDENLFIPLIHELHESFLPAFLLLSHEAIFHVY